MSREELSEEELLDLESLEVDSVAFYAGRHLGAETEADLLNPNHLAGDVKKFLGGKLAVESTIDLPEPDEQ